MSALEVFPDALLSRDKEAEVILFLQALPVPDRRKKEALVDWTRFTGAALTEELVEKLLGPLAGRSRG